MDNSKNCNKCGTTKDADQFYRDPNRKSGLTTYCKECIKAKTRKRKAEKPDLVRGSNLKYKFGITAEMYDVMLLEQDGRCAICKSTCSSGRALAVDHDHSCCPGKRSCGKCVRKLLCGNCNTALGKFNDDVELLKSAIEYLS